MEYLVSPCVVVVDMVVLSEECVEAPVGRQEGCVAVAEVPLTHLESPGEGTAGGEWLPGSP